ncbi:hypothetical protein [Tuwongella immobilis]|uniref:Uncharacterized protein n=1 Tax=Tuwongella immobilis TaxID=692036 RepID=A0A6C2YKA2_9BACT|nr:hypothetical protein [Tuwongella immobilis]VIP02010.1 unnamed protein product [Tuwongella immobilis]VTS00117.1 unnamed protein product [Tuwongella immobilis]
MTRYLIWMVALLIVWLVNIGLVYGAFRLHLGRAGFRGLDRKELIWRTLFAAAGMTLIVPLIYLPVLGFFPKTISTVAVLGFIALPIAGQWLNFSLGMDEFIDGFSVAIMQMLVPVLMLVIVWRFDIPLKRWLMLG